MLYVRIEQSEDWSWPLVNELFWWREMFTIEADTRRFNSESEMRWGVCGGRLYIVSNKREDARTLQCSTAADDDVCCFVLSERRIERKEGEWCGECDCSTCRVVVGERGGPLAVRPTVEGWR